MLEDQQVKRNLTIIGIIIIIIVLTLGAAAIILISPNVGIIKDSTTSSSTDVVLTANYSNISVEDAYELINNSENINIIDDPTGCHCRYDDVHIGNPPYFEAILVTKLPQGIASLYNTTNDTIIYDDRGTGHGINRCIALVNNVYGDIYYLEGGLNAWQKKKYPVVEE